MTSGTPIGFSPNGNGTVHFAVDLDGKYNNVYTSMLKNNNKINEAIL